jgi:cob(I)alamin adenosyltransferase
MYSGERVSKRSEVMAVLGAVDEAQAFLGMARAECAAGDELGGLLVDLERDLWIVMAEIATTPGSARAADAACVEAAMIVRLEHEIDRAMARSGEVAGFAVPGEGRLSASLDVARTVVRRAERLAVGLDRGDSLVVAYLNRLSDLCWALARASEDAVRTNAGARATVRRERVRADTPVTGEDETGETPT